MSGGHVGKALADEVNKQRCHELDDCATTFATKALAKDEYNKDDDYVVRQFEAYAASFFARVEAIMAKIQAMDDGFGNWAVTSSLLRRTTKPQLQ